MPTELATVPPGGLVTVRRREDLPRYYRLGFQAERISPTGIVMRRGGAEPALAAPAAATPVLAPARRDTLGMTVLALGTLALFALIAR